MASEDHSNMAFEDFLPETLTHSDDPDSYYYGPYGLDDYHDNISSLQEAQANFSLAVVVVLVMALVVLAFTWYRNRERQAYRYAFLMLILGSSLLYQAAHFSSKLVYWYELPNQILLFSLTGYILLTAIHAMKQSVTGSQALLAMAVCIAVPFGAGLLRWRLRTVTFNLALELCLAIVPNMVVLLIGLALNVLILYWVFALDNTRYKHHRDYRVVRHGCVCSLLVLLYCLGLETVMVVFIARPDIWSLKGMIHYGFSFEARGVVLTLLLCLLDLEVWAACPCNCVELEDEEDEEVGTKPLANAGALPANEQPEGKIHVTSFETEITPRLTLQSKPAYGTIQE